MEEMESQEKQEQKQELHKEKQELQNKIVPILVNTSWNEE